MRESVRAIRGPCDLVNHEIRAIHAAFGHALHAPRERERERDGIGDGSDASLTRPAAGSLFRLLSSATSDVTLTRVRREDEYHVRLSLFRKEKFREEEEEDSAGVAAPRYQTPRLTPRLRDVRVAEFDSEMGKRRLRGPRRIIYQTPSLPFPGGKFRVSHGNRFLESSRKRKLRARSRQAARSTQRRAVLITRARLQPRT